MEDHKSFIYNNNQEKHTNNWADIYLYKNEYMYIYYMYIYTYIYIYYIDRSIDRGIER